MPDASPIFEESKLTLRLKVTKGDTPEKSVEFILLVDGEEHSKHMANLQGAAFAWPTVAPKIDDAKVKQWPYELKYQVKHGEDTHDAVESWTVWPRNLELATQGNDTPVQLKLLQQDKPIKAPPKVDKDKTAKVTLQRPEAFIIQAAFPWKVKDGATNSGQGRKKTVELEKVPFQVRFVLPDGGDDAGSPIKQLVTVKTEGSKIKLYSRSKVSTRTSTLRPRVPPSTCAPRSTTRPSATIPTSPANSTLTGSRWQATCTRAPSNWTRTASRPACSIWRWPGARPARSRSDPPINTATPRSTS